MLPAFVVVGFGVDSTQALVLSQVVLSIALPLPMIALLFFTGRADIMGRFVNSAAHQCRGDRRRRDRARCSIVFLIVADPGRADPRPVAWLTARREPRSRRDVPSRRIRVIKPAACTVIEPAASGAAACRRAGSTSTSISGPTRSPGSGVSSMTPEEAALNLAAAFCLSAVIGFERQWRNRLAGLRTNTLVALGAATFVVFAQLYPEEASPTRVAAQVVSGIGFLGAGLIFREGLSVRGLNTAATLWCSAAIGVLAGAGLPLYAASPPASSCSSTCCCGRSSNFINRQPLTGDRARGRLPPLGDLQKPRRGAYPRPPAAGPRRRRVGVAAPRQHRSRRDGPRRGDGAYVTGGATGRYRRREDRRPSQSRADGFGGALAGRRADRIDAHGGERVASGPSRPRPARAAK